NHAGKQDDQHAGGKDQVAVAQASEQILQQLAGTQHGQQLLHDHGDGDQGRQHAGNLAGTQHDAGQGSKTDLSGNGQAGDQGEAHGDGGSFGRGEHSRVDAIQHHTNGREAQVGTAGKARAG